MKKNITTFLLICLFLVISFLMGRYFDKLANTPKVNDTIAPKIETIIIKNDSILRINDSINFKVIEIERTYEKTVNDIIRNTPDDDYNFFSDYIERYCGHNNSDSAQNSEFNIR